MSTIGRCGSCRRISFSNSMPLRSGKLTSRSRRSYGCSPRRESPDCAVSAIETRYPSVFRRSSSPSRISASSSITRIEPLGMNCVPHGRKFNMEGSTSPGGGAHIDLAGMFFDDTITHGQTKASAAATGFGREKRVKNLMDVVAGNPVARVRHFDFHASVMSAGADFQDSARGHGIARVQEEIQENLLQFVGGAAHRWKSVGKMLHHLDLGGFQRMGDQRKSFFHYAV